MADENIFEEDEDFSVALSNPSGGAGLGDHPVATVRIFNDDSLPDFWVQDVTAEEGSGGGTTIFHVTVMKDNGGKAAVDFFTQGGTALAGPDYQSVSTTLTFDEQEMMKDVLIEVAADDMLEEDEFFGVLLSNPVGGTISINSATATITNDDAPPTRHHFRAHTGFRRARRGATHR